MKRFIKMFIRKIFFKWVFIKTAKNLTLTRMASQFSISRIVYDKSCTESRKDAEYSPITGAFIGYLENDEHYRKRIIEAIT